MAVLAPEAAKATTLDAGLTHFSFPIEKSKDTDTINPVDGTPDIEIWGKATDGTLDSDLQVVDPDASLKWIKTWYDTKANIRMGHDPQRPVGRGIEIDGHYVKALIAEPTAKHLIRSKVLNDFSVGIMNPDIRVGDPRFKHLDPMGKAVRGVITDRPDGLTALGEISVVDRGSNFGSSFQIAKAAADGSPEFTGKLFAPDDLLAKVGAPAATKSFEDPGRDGVTVTLPKDMSMSIKPTQLAKLATFGQKLAQQQAAVKASAPSVTKAVTPDVAKKDYSAEERRELAAKGWALKDGSYPIKDAEDLGNAATLAKSKHGNWKAALRLIAKRARQLGVPNPAAPAEKAAKPDAAKCACSGGMMDGKPCGSCKAGKRMAKQMAKATTPDAEKGKGKLKALCPGCGAKQNHKHEFCTECGRQLPAKPPMVAKNHDFMCLGCGTDLDKGEKHCPKCGKENPGYNAMADQKIPVNQDKAVKARKDRVAKGKKKGKKAGKGEPFGGAQAKPFGSDKDGDGEKEPDAKDAKKTAKAKTATKGMKPGKGKKPKDKHKPTPAEAGGVPGQHDMPAPPHREPDGGEVENFERDAHMQDGDDEKPTPMEARTMKGDPEAAAAMALKALDVPQHLGALHALTCPAYSPESVAKAFPHASFAAIDVSEWHAGALEKAASAPLAEAQGALGIYQAAVTLKGADPYALLDVRTAAYKAFRDANPGPGSFPEPGQISPTRFSRPYISDGHGAASPGHMGPNHARVPAEGGIVSTDYDRPYLDAGHASESPTNQHTPGPMQAPSQTGVPTHEPAQGFLSSNAIASMQHAMSAMHDHISRRFPDVCPMEASLDIGSHPVPVPHGVPQPSKAPGARKAAKAAKAKARKAAKVKARKMAAQRKKLQAKVLKGAMSVADARVKMGMKPLTPVAPPESPTSAGAASPVVAALDPEALKAALVEATAPLQAQLAKSRKAVARQDKALARQGKAFRKLQKTTDAIASQPDTSASPMRMAALTKSTASAAPVGPQTVSATAEQAQITKMRLLHDTWRSSPDPQQREAAYAEYTRLLGINSMTPPANPMT